SRIQSETRPARGYQTADVAVFGDDRRYMRYSTEICKIQWIAPRYSSHSANGPGCPVARRTRPATTAASNVWLKIKRSSILPTRGQGRGRRASERIRLQPRTSCGSDVYIRVELISVPIATRTGRPSALTRRAM